MIKYHKKLRLQQDDGISKLWLPHNGNNYSREFYLDPLIESVKKLPIHMCFVIEEYCYTDYYRKRECSNIFSIEFVLEGSMLFKQNDVEHRVMPGEIFFIHQGQDLEYMTGPEHKCHRLACCVGGHLLNDLLVATHLIDVSVMKPQNAEVVEAIMRKCKMEYSKCQKQFRLRASVLCYELLLLLGNDISYSNQPALLQKSIDYMEHHISRKFDLDYLSSVVGTSPATLNRLFHRYLKTSPIGYFIDLKIKMAQSLLLNTGLRIKEIANRTGYSNPLYFSSEFSKRVGLSPRNFRKNNNSKNALFEI